MPLLLLTGDGAPLVDPITLGSIEVPIGLPGLVASVESASDIILGSIEVPVSLPGPTAPVNPADVQPIVLGSIELRVISYGPIVLDPPSNNPWHPQPIPDYPMYPVRVTGVPDGEVLVADVTPQANDVGNGTLETLHPVPSDAFLTVTFGGRTWFSGLASEVEQTVVAPAEEHDQTTRTTLVGAADELRHTVVLPMFGATDVKRLGKPPQDVRVFDWTHVGVDPAGWSLSTSKDPITEALKEDNGIELPDPWPDPFARWMRGSADDIGWQHFRVPINPGAELCQVWMCVSEGYAQCAIDGVIVLEANSAGVPAVETLDLSYHPHLVAIRAFMPNDGHLMFTIMPAGFKGLYGEPLMNSRSGWKVIPRADKAVWSTGRILTQLWSEARTRGSTSWGITCSKAGDSAGRAWPDRDEPLSLDTGMTYLDVLNRLAETEIDWVARPGSRTVDVYRKGEGSGRSAPAPFTPGVSLGHRTLTTTSRQ